MTTPERAERALILAEYYPQPYILIDSLIAMCYRVYGREHFMQKALNILDFAVEWAVPLNDSYHMQYNIDFELDTFRF